MVKTIALYKNFFSVKVLNAQKRSWHYLRFTMSVKKQVGQFKKAYLHRPIKNLHFLTLTRIEKYLTYLTFNI